MPWGSASQGTEVMTRVSVIVPTCNRDDATRDSAPTYREGAYLQ